MSFFSDTGCVLRREFRRIRSNAVYPTIMIIMPVVALLFFASLLSIGVPSDIPVAVVDNDKTVTSRKLVNMIDATASVKTAFSVPDMAEAEKMLKEGDVMAIVYIPYNFEKDILSNTRTAVTSYLSGLNITANGLIGKDIQTAVTTFTTGVQRQVLMSQGLSEKEALAAALPVYFDRHILFNPYVNYGYYLMPSFMPMMLMIFALVMTIYAIGSELKNGTSKDWVDTAGGKISAALFGKLIPYTVALFILSLFMNTMMYRWLGIPLNGSITILTLSTFLFILAYQSIGVLIITILANLRQALSIGGGYSVLAFTFSGLTFPRMAMLPILQVLSYIFPFTVYTDIIVDQAMRGAPVVYSIQYMGILSLYAILPTLCLPRLRRICYDRKFWRRK